MTSKKNVLKVKFETRAAAEFKKLPSNHQEQIDDAIEVLKVNPFAGEKVAGFPNFRRLKSGMFRIIYAFMKDKSLIIVLRIEHRREIYRKL